MQTVAVRLERGIRTPPVAIEVFTGSGKWARAMGQKGFWVIVIDIVFGFDMTGGSNVRLVQGWLIAGLVSIIHFGTPCNSWSRARDRPNGPPRLRDDGEGLLGLPGLSPGDLAKVQTGNKLM